MALGRAGGGQSGWSARRGRGSCAQLFMTILRALMRA